MAVPNGKNIYDRTIRSQDSLVRNIKNKVQRLYGNGLLVSYKGLRYSLDPLVTMFMFSYLYLTHQVI